MTEASARLHRQRWAQLRLQVIGHLLAAPPAPGALQAQLTALAQRTWRNPVTGLDVRFGVSTIERWYTLARKSDDPTAQLTSQARTDTGVQRAISDDLAVAIKAQYARSPGWNVQLHYDNLKVEHGEAVPSYPTGAEPTTGRPRHHGQLEEARAQRNRFGVERARQNFSGQRSPRRL